MIWEIIIIFFFTFKTLLWMYLSSSSCNWITQGRVSVVMKNMTNASPYYESHRSEWWWSQTSFSKTWRDVIHTKDFCSFHFDDGFVVRHPETVSTFLLHLPPHQKRDKQNVNKALIQSLIPNVCFYLSVWHLLCIFSLVWFCVNILMAIETWCGVSSLC